jgi:hypothetical protein
VDTAIDAVATIDGMTARTPAKTAREACATRGEKTDAIEATRAASRTLKTAAAAAGTEAAAIATVATVATAAATAGAVIVIADTVVTVEVIAEVIVRVACASIGKRDDAIAVNLAVSPTRANNALRRLSPNHVFTLFFTVDPIDDEYDKPRIKVDDDVYICCC